MSFATTFSMMLCIWLIKYVLSKWLLCILYILLYMYYYIFSPSNHICLT